MKIWHVVYSTNRDPTKNIATDTYTSLHRYAEQVKNMRGHFQTKTISSLNCYSVTFEPGQDVTHVEVLEKMVHPLPKIMELNTELC